jgi:class 3 adenylate cyclase
MRHRASAGNDLGGAAPGGTPAHATLVARQVAGHSRHPLAVAAVGLALALPLAGLAVLLNQQFASLHWQAPALHFTFFLVVGATAASLSLVTGEGARRRGDARCLLLSLAFLSMGGFMALHAAGTKDVLTQVAKPGFTIAISAGLLAGAPFALGSAFVDLHPGAGVLVMRWRRWLRAAVLTALLLWAVWAWLQWPPLQQGEGEGLQGTPLQIAAALGAAAYLVAAVRLWWMHRRDLGMLVFSVVACYTLLAEALVGVAVAGENKWHPTWWVWHGLIVTGFLLVFGAAHREWHDERFRALYLPATREHREEVSVLVADLEGFTTFSDTRDPAEVAAMLRTYYQVAAPLISRGFGGEVEKFAGDGVFATFNRRGDQRDHAVRAVQAALALQEAVEAIREDRPDWPGLRVGVNTGSVVVAEMGGIGYVAYPAVGDAVNVAARLQEAAPVGGVLVGESTRRQLPDDLPVRRIPDLHLKGKSEGVDAYLVGAPLLTASGGRHR